VGRDLFGQLGAAPDRGYRVLHQRDQDVPSRRRLAGVAEDDRDIGVEIDRRPDGIRVVAARPVEAVHGEDERDVVLLKVVNGGEAVGQPPGVREDDRTERAARQLVPHEPEPFLAGRPEQVDHQVLPDGDPAEVQGNGGGALALHPVQHVHVPARLGQRLLGAQRADLGHRADQGGLAYPEPSGNEDLDADRYACPVVRGGVGHRRPP
jgi:hypothetical protein